jgi:hypothetical protein
MAKIIQTFLLCIFVLSSCSEPDFVVQPSCDEDTNVEVWVPGGATNGGDYLGFCEKFFEGEKPMVVEISIDGLKIKDNMLTTDFRGFYEFDITNSKSRSGDTNFKFPIKVPKCGSFVVTIIVRGQDGSCFKCCSTQDMKSSCPTNQGTKAVYRGQSIKFNVDLKNPPPSAIKIDPVGIGCNSNSCKNC